jgi:uncharacterized spore protein YtfJ
MSTAQNIVRKEEEKISQSGRDNRDPFLVRVAERLGMSANASTIFSSPIERDGVTVVPVAKARYGFGGGGGSRERENGFGGGGGITVTPVGFIEIKAGEARFRGIRKPLLLGPLVATSGLLALLATTAIYRTLRR